MASQRDRRYLPDAAVAHSPPLNQIGKGVARLALNAHSFNQPATAKPVAS